MEAGNGYVLFSDIAPHTWREGINSGALCAVARCRTQPLSSPTASVIIFPSFLLAYTESTLLFTHCLYVCTLSERHYLERGHRPIDWLTLASNLDWLRLEDSYRGSSKRDSRGSSEKVSSRGSSEQDSSRGSIKEDSSRGSNEPDSSRGSSE
jgi:hypothetical protein